MKHIRLALLLAASSILAAFTINSTHAQALAAETTATAPETSAYSPHTTLPTDLKPASDPTPTIIADLAVKYPIISTVVFLVGILRLVIKPIMAAIQAHVASTPDTADDERLARAQRSWWLRAVLFILDWGASVKPVK